MILPICCVRIYAHPHSLTNLRCLHEKKKKKKKQNKTKKKKTTTNSASLAIQNAHSEDSDQTALMPVTRVIT